MGWITKSSLLALGLVLAAPASAQVSEWSSDFGRITLEIDYYDVHGSYPSYNGEFIGEYNPEFDLLSLYWVQPSSEVKCRELINGSPYWGTVDFYGLSSGHLRGEWAYCDNLPGSGGAWNAKLLAGDLPPQADPAIYGDEPLPVYPEDTEPLIYEAYGKSFPWNEAQSLVFDFTCDGVEDTVIGWVEGTNPDALGAYNIMVVYDLGFGLEQSSLQLASDGSHYGLCTGPDGWPDPLLEIEYMGQLEPDAFGLSPGCGAKVRIDDGYCDYLRLY